MNKEEFENNRYRNILYTNRKPEIILDYQEWNKLIKFLNKENIPHKVFKFPFKVMLIILKSRKVYAFSLINDPIKYKQPIGPIAHAFYKECNINKLSIEGKYGYNCREIKLSNYTYIKTNITWNYKVAAGFQYTHPQFSRQ